MGGVMEKSKNIERYNIKRDNRERDNGREGK
jgi:hypothetical protein